MSRAHFGQAFWKRRLRPCAALVSLALLAVLGLPNVAQAQPAGARNSAESQLQAIREALIEKAMGSNTRVSATSWVNERGELMEASQFRTDMQVRGVRVLEYMDGQEPKAVVDVAAGSKPDARAAQQPVCRDESAGEAWRHPVTLRVQAAQVLDPHAGALVAQAAQWVEAALRAQARAEGSPLDAALLPVATNRYEEALWSVPQPRSPMVLSVRVRATPGWDASVSGSRRMNWESRARGWVGWAESDRQAMTLRLEWSLARAGEAPILLVHSELPGVVDASQRPTRQWGDEVRAHLAREVAHRWQSVQGTLDCEPLVFEARSQGEGVVTLMAGQDAGLRAGDRLVLVDGRHVPRRMLEADSAPHLALLEVQQVQGQRAQARQVAGPKVSLAGSQNWLAIPYGASLLAARQESVK